MKTEKGSAIYRQDKEEGKYKIIGYKENVYYTQKICCFRECGMIVWLLLIKDGREARMMYPHKKENLTYFITYQLNYMYVRYFLWNFVGRQNDIQGSGEPEHGNWITGISWLDNLRLGDQGFYRNLLQQNKKFTMFSMACRFY